MIDPQAVGVAKKQGWIMFCEQGHWKRWSGPWASVEEARQIIDEHIVPKKPNEMFVVVGTNVRENPWHPDSGNWSIEPNYAELHEV